MKHLAILSGVFFVLIGAFNLWDFTPRLHKEVLEAQEFLSQQDYNKAIRKYDEILIKNPNKELKVKIFYQLGEIYSINLGKNKKAIEYYKKVKNITEDPLFLVKSEERIGEISFSFLKNYKISYSSYEMLSNFTPRLKKQDFYQLRLALSALNLRKEKSSIKLFEKIQSNQNHSYFTRSFYYLGLIYFQQKDWLKAIFLWKEYIKRETVKEHVVQAKFLMANAYESMEKLNLAYNLYYSILGIYPNTQVVQNRLNAIYNRRIARKR